MTTALLLAFSAAALAGELDKKALTLAPPEDSWQFKLSLPGWAPWLSGDTSFNGKTTHLDLDPGDIIRHIDMAADIRAEAQKGRFSVMSEFLYMSLSDGIGTNTIVKKLDVQVDQTMADLGVGWRVLERPRGFLDVIAGVRYTNFFQKVALQPNDQRIDDASEKLVDTVSDRLRTELSESGLRKAVADEITSRLAALDLRDPRLPIAPIVGGESGPIRERIQRAVDAKKAQLLAALRERASAAAGAARAAAQRKVDSIKKDLQKEISRTLHTKLDRTVSRLDDWWDPYIGLRGRYNFNDTFYLAVKGDVGGFGVGADLTWQAEAALGAQLSRNIFAEFGYRALGVDYEHDGLSMDTITHGFQFNAGMLF